MEIATAKDAPQIASLLTATSERLTDIYGKGHWSHQTTVKGVLFGMKQSSKVLVMKRGEKIVGTLRLTTKKPWAIDANYFTKVSHPLYLVDMSVQPDLQRTGIGRLMLQEAKSYVKTRHAQAIRLDAYNAPAGAAEFYRKCGYKEVGRVVYKGTPLIYFELML